jgi:DNA-binding LacI/PurR family transcriptional regulator
MFLALKLLRRFGYRRIGLFLQQHSERRSNHTYLAALSYFQSTIPCAERLDPMIFKHAEDTSSLSSKFEIWLRREKPDVVIGQHRELVNWLEKAGLSIPRDIGVVHLAIEDDVANWTGIWQRKREIGAETAELLISMLQNNRFGLPAVARDILIPGYWSRGTTLEIPRRTYSRR